MSGFDGLPNLCAHPDYKITAFSQFFGCQHIILNIAIAEVIVAPIL